jgi:hypothetical protein
MRSACCGGGKSVTGEKNLDELVPLSGDSLERSSGLAVLVETEVLARRGVSVREEEVSRSLRRAGVGEACMDNIG